MKATAMRMGIVGCGDFLRWQSDDIKKSKLVTVTKLFDPDTKRATRYAEILGGQAVESAEDIFTDPEIELVCLFVPPWVRKSQMVACAKSGKHVLTTKPLGSTVAECASMVRAFAKPLRCGVIYRRTSGALFKTYRQIFDGGSIGRLSLYKQDWIHHYPQWNTWALDPARNGGPFMDAMVHNLNIARYLMGRAPKAVTYFSESHAHKLPCADTEFMKLDFAAGGSAHLFITWAADLAVYGTDGNNREHVDITYMVTDKGWRLTDGWQDGKQVITASKEGKTKTWVVKPFSKTVYDRFVQAVRTRAAQPTDLPSVVEAYEDIKIVRDAERGIGKATRPVTLKLV